MMEWVEAGQFEAYPSGGTRVDVAGHRVAVFRIEDDLYAIGDLCSHAEASLAEGELFDDEVECPRHGSEFNIKTGEPGSLPATRSVGTYEIKVENETVMIRLEPQEEA
jgi:3-phenylpropionate/trans-cinnamate dioxygenase ferredoxin subunit